MYCGKCGQEIKEGYKFCDNCGNEIDNIKETDDKVSIIFENKNRYLKVAGIIAILIIAVFSINSIRVNSHIKSIKNNSFYGYSTHFSEYSKYKVGKIFSQVFNNNKWKYLGKDIIQFTGKLEDVKIVIQFKDNKDNTFDITYLSIDGYEMGEWLIDFYIETLVGVYIDNIK